MHLKSFIRMLLAIGLLAPAMVLAQEAPAENSESNNAQAMQHEHGEGNCFKQAGISQSTMEQIKDLHQKMHQQAVDVCQNTSLSADQKREQLKQLHEQTHSQTMSLLSPEQQQKIKQCHGGKMEEHEGRMAGKGHGMHGDPCAHILAHKDKDKDHDQK